AVTAGKECRMGAVHVTVMCPDLDAALRFYRHGLGLTRIQEWESVQATAVEGDVVYDGRFACIEMGTDSYLELYPAATASGPESMNAPHVLGMAVHDVDETYRRCVATGGERLDVDGWDGEPRT